MKTPETYAEEMATKHAEKWKKACDDEMRSAKNLNVNQIVDTPKDRKKITTKWFFKVKQDEAGNV